MNNQFTEVSRSENSITISYYDDDGAKALLVHEEVYTLEELEEANVGDNLFSSLKYDE